MTKRTVFQMAKVLFEQNGKKYNKKSVTIHCAYAVTQRCAIIVKLTPNLCNLLPKQITPVFSKRTKIFYSKLNLKK
jgi:hypothetical protein